LWRKRHACDIDLFWVTWFLVVKHANTLL
jgi:hypothetical protein